VQPRNRVERPSGVEHLRERLRVVFASERFGVLFVG
jgi:hypothetical protein